MKRRKANPELVTALTDLRDWTWLEAKAEESPKFQRKWLDVRDWANGTAIKYGVDLHAGHGANLSPANVNVEAPNA